MPDDAGGRPFPDGWEPDDETEHGGADEEFATVVFDEDFVKAAEIHEPTAVERLLEAARARAEADAASRSRAQVYDDGFDDGPDHPYHHDGFDDDRDDVVFADDLDDLDDGYTQDRPYPYRGSTRWHRPVAWILALAMGIGMVALAFTAVYRGASSGSEDGRRSTPPRISTGSPSAGNPSASADYSQPAVPATPRTP